MSTELVIHESGLTFILDQDRAYLPERESFYQSLSAQASIKICDVICLNLIDELLVIEVKSSSPQEHRQFVQEIKQKFADTLLLYIGTVLKRKNTQSDTLPAALQESALQGNIRLVLIINGHKRDWLPPLRDSLRKECRALEKVFSLEETQVYNPQLARQKLSLKIEEHRE
ncbi:MAG: hypothetical protein R2911_19195 [Caldilineaceae bacterium]